MDPHAGPLPTLKAMVDRATGWKFAWQHSPLAACPQEVKDGVEDGTKVGGSRSPRLVAPAAEPGQPRPTPRRSGRCRRIECSSYGPFGPDQRSFKKDANFTAIYFMLSAEWHLGKASSWTSCTTSTALKPFRFRWPSALVDWLTRRLVRTRASSSRKRCAQSYRHRS